MRKLILSFMVAVMVAPLAMAMDRETALEIRRIDQKMLSLQAQIGDLLQTFRKIERNMDSDAKQIVLINRKITDLADDLVKTQNLDIPNLQAGQKTLYDQVDVLNWGRKERECKDIGKHQQVKAVQSDDGVYTLRYLCFDGVAIHLGTEVNQPPR